MARTPRANVRPHRTQLDKTERKEPSDKEIQFSYSEVTGYFLEKVFYIVEKINHATNILRPRLENQFVQTQRLPEGDRQISCCTVRFQKPAWRKSSGWDSGLLSSGEACSQIAERGRERDNLGSNVASRLQLRDIMPCQISAAVLVPVPRALLILCSCHHWSGSLPGLPRSCSKLHWWQEIRLLTWAFK